MNQRFRMKAIRGVAAAGLVSCAFLEITQNPDPLSEPRMGADTSMKSDLLFLAGGLTSAAVLLLTDKDEAPRRTRKR